MCWPQLLSHSVDCERVQQNASNICAVVDPQVDRFVSSTPLTTQLTLVFSALCTPCLRSPVFLGERLQSLLEPLDVDGYRNLDPMHTSPNELENGRG